MVFITNRALARRTFLRGLGTTLALPFLESMLPALTPLRLTARVWGSLKPGLPKILDRA